MTPHSSSSILSPLILGTVQLGLAYGISQDKQLISQQKADDILQTAWQHGIHTLDTAYHYGVSEARIGDFQQRTHHQFNIHSKTQQFANTPDIQARHCQQLKQQLDSSLATLNADAFASVLIHHLSDVQKPGGLSLWQSLKQHPKVQQAGVSVYTADDIDWVLANLDPDIIQLPFNILDQRLWHSGHLEMLHKRGIRIHARSVFLQGLLLMSPDKVAQQHLKALSAVQAFLQRCHDYQCSAQQLALHFALQQPWIDRLVIGVHSADELIQLIGNMKFIPDACCLTSCDTLSITDPDIIDPRHWS